jgi:hypothetical protein
MMMKKTTLLAGFSALLTLSALATEAPRNRMPQGGGVIYPAWTGEYFANPELSGKPAWTRSDIRVRFDWETWRPILGVRAESVRDFPRENISARWSAKLIARFQEEYTFKLLSDEQARFKIRPEGSKEWKTLIDAWAPHARRTDSAKMKLAPGTVYEVQIDYANLKGDAVCSLSWSSPSTPEEVVDYAAANSVHFAMVEAMANLFSFCGKPSDSTPRPTKSAENQGTKTDENGWPVQDFKESLLQLYSHYVGRGQIVFKGQAEVNISSATLEVDGKNYEKLPKGVGYNPAKNETRAFINWTAKQDMLTTSILTMSQTQRTPESPVGSGVTDVEVMLPKQAGGTEPHEPGEIVHQEMRDAYLPVFTFRMQGTGLNDIEKWSERTLPTYSKIMGQVWRADVAYEKLILAANEIGRDLHLNFSGSCDEEFMYKLALLVKYGSDGKEPYTQPVPNPVWPPLNPNLRLYLEHGNEMAWSAIQPREWQNDFARHREAKDEIWQAVNFDGAVEKDQFNGLLRYHAYRTARMSENMRKVWGDAGMGETIRVCLFGQYERYFQSGMVQFLNDYFGNPAYVKEPRKPSELLWASGPAVYYGTVNNFMDGGPLFLTNGSFEESSVNPGEALLTPSNVKGWSYSGGAGVVDARNQRHEAVQTVQTSGGTIKLDRAAVVGFQFTVGPKDLFVYEVGRVNQAGERGKMSTVIIKLDGKALAASRHLPATLKEDAAGKATFSALEYSGWATTDASRIGIWRLVAGQTYAVITTADKGTHPDGNTGLMAGPGLTIDGAVLVEGGSIDQRGLKGGALKLVSGAGQGFPHVTFRYAPALDPAPGMAIIPSDPLLDPEWLKGGKGKSFVPEFHRDGTKAAFLAGKGKLSQTFSVPKAGEYALVFTANGSLNSTKLDARTGDNPFTIKIDGKIVWDDTVGDGRKPNGGVFQWGSSYLTLQAGSHTLEIESRSDNPKDTVYFYAMHLGDLETYYGGPGAPNFLGAGAATGQTDGRFELISQLCTGMAHLWGLVPYAYEGGTQAGGDWNGGKLLYPEQFKWEHPMSKVADHQWARMWHKHGGYNAFYYYPGFPYTHAYKAETFMPWAAGIERAHGWELEPTATVAAPITFTPDQPHYQGQPKSTWDGWFHPWLSEKALSALTATLAQPEVWKGFVFRAPKAGEYTITAQTTAGGEAELVVNDSQSVLSGPSGTPLSTKVFLTQGVHSVRLKNLSGSFDLQSVEIK